MWQVIISNYFASLPSFLRSFGYSILAPVSDVCCWFKMRLSHPLSLGSLVTSALATNLYVSSYAGTITSLNLNQERDGSFSLNEVGVNTGSQPNPSWLTKDEYNDVVYCVDEQLLGPPLNGSLASYSTSKSGQLTQIDRHSVINGPVSSVVYNGGKALALAH
jgi:Lactonase, 7-bladed beta-propeller